MNTTFQIESIFPITGRGMYISAKLENEDNRNSYCDCNIGGIPILGWDIPRATDENGKQRTDLIIFKIGEKGTTDKDFKIKIGDIVELTSNNMTTTITEYSPYMNWLENEPKQKFQIGDSGNESMILTEEYKTWQEAKPAITREDRIALMEKDDKARFEEFAKKYPEDIGRLYEIYKKLVAQKSWSEDFLSGYLGTIGDLIIIVLEKVPLQ